MINLNLEYIWIDNNNGLRSKTKVQIIDLNNLFNLKPEFLPEWNYDGSSTNQASGIESEVILQPKAIFNDPFREGNHKLVLCDTWTPEGKQLESNNRKWANDIFNKKLNEKPWFGLEQEYFMMNKKTNKPLGFPDNNTYQPKSQGKYYCGVGTNNIFCRHIVEMHLQACIDTGIKISGINAEVAPGQWEFQIGPCEGIDAGDHLWVARYLLERIAEEHDIIIDYSPKPLDGDWNGSGCHTNYSTLNMREGTSDKKGIEFIDEAIEKLSKKHKEHMDVYGEDNNKRMTGKHETASYDKFTDGIANRGCSIRRGNMTVKNKKGYFEDRRPSSNCDPYLVTAKIFETTIL